MSMRTKMQLARKRSFRVRNKISNVQYPRLSLFVSGRHIHCQVIDDVSSRTLASASSCQLSSIEGLLSTSNCMAAGRIGALIAQRAISVGIARVVFDRGPRRYHGRVKAFVEAARDNGLTI